MKLTHMPLGLYPIILSPTAKTKSSASHNQADTLVENGPLPCMTQRVLQDRMGLGEGVAVLHHHRPQLTPHNRACVVDLHRLGAQ